MALTHAIVQVSNNRRLKRSRVLSGMRSMGFLHDMHGSYWWEKSSFRWSEEECHGNWLGNQALWHTPFTSNVWTSCTAVLRTGIAQRNGNMQCLWCTCHTWGSYIIHEGPASIMPCTEFWGTRAKMHGKIAMRMVYAFSRIAKWFDCINGLFALALIYGECLPSGVHTDQDVLKSVRSIPLLGCRSQAWDMITSVGLFCCFCWMHHGIAKWLCEPMLGRDSASSDSSSESSTTDVSESEDIVSSPWFWIFVWSVWAMQDETSTTTPSSSNGMHAGAGSERPLVEQAPPGEPQLAVEEPIGLERKPHLKTCDLQSTASSVKSGFLHACDLGIFLVSMCMCNWRWEFMYTISKADRPLMLVFCVQLVAMHSLLQALTTWWTRKHRKSWKRLTLWQSVSWHILVSYSHMLYCYVMLCAWLRPWCA